MQNIYQEQEQKYQEYYDKNEVLEFNDTNLEGQNDYDQKTWYLASVTYVGDDYVSLLFNDVHDWPGSPHPMSIFRPITINVETGKLVVVEEILKCTRDELLQRVFEESGVTDINDGDYGFYLLGEEIHFIYRFNVFVDEIVILRERTNK